MSRIVLFLSKRNVMIEIQRDLCLQTPSSFQPNNQSTHVSFSSNVLDAIGKCCYIRTFSSHARAASTWGSISPGKRVIRHPACPVAPWSLSHPGSTFLSWWQVGGGNLKCTWPHSTFTGLVGDLLWPVYNAEKCQFFLDQLLNIYIGGWSASTFLQIVIWIYVSMH